MISADARISIDEQDRAAPRDVGRERRRRGALGLGVEQIARVRRPRSGASTTRIRSIESLPASERTTSSAALEVARARHLDGLAQLFELGFERA